MRRYLTFFFFFFNDTATTEIYTLSLHDALPISLSQAIGGRPVQFAADCVGAEAERIVNALKAGDVALLENLRFHPEEEANDPDFASQLAALGDVYVDDAFSAAHRAHASIVALAHLLPAAAGKSMQAELEALGAAFENPRHPVMRSEERRVGKECR